MPVPCAAPLTCSEVPEALRNPVRRMACLVRVRVRVRVRGLSLG